MTFAQRPKLVEAKRRKHADKTSSKTWGAETAATAMQHSDDVKTTEMATKAAKAMLTTSRRLIEMTCLAAWRNEIFYEINVPSVIMRKERKSVESSPITAETALLEKIHFFFLIFWRLRP